MKKLVMFLGLILTAGTLVACSGETSDSGSSNETEGSEETVSLRFATGFSGGDGQIGQTMSKFKELVENESNGTIEIEIFDSGSLGDERSILESVSTGSIDVALSGLSDVVYWLPEYFLSAPYLFRDQEHVRAVYEGELGQEIDQKILEDRDIRTLAIMDRGARHLTSNKEVHSPEDIDGLKLRLSENPLWVDTWETLGANTTVVPLSELYTALQTGVVEAQENPIETIYQNQFHEVQENLILTGHVRDIFKIQMSDEIWQELSSDQLNTLENAAVEASKLGDEILEQATEEQLKELEESGVNIIEPDLDVFREVLEGSGEEIANAHMKEGLYEKVKNEY